MKSLAIALLLIAASAFAQVVPGGAPSAPNPPTSQITGNLQTATGGAVTNGTLSFTLSQPAIVSGTSSVAANTVSCYTSTAGNIVGVPDPLAPPVLSANLISGTLPAGTYFVEFVYVGPGGTKSVPSPEAQIQLAAQGTLNVNAPAIQPASATGFYAVYIGTTSGAETLQGTATSWTHFSQSAPLVVGSSLPVSNNTSCNVWFSDTLIPTGTFYTVSLVNRNGSLIAGFPQTWCTFGGAGGTINVSQGAPTGNCGTNGVFYPTPIFAVPANGSQQSISGPLIVPSLTVTSLNNIKFADQFSSVQAAINSLPSSGGTVYLTCGSSYTGPTTIPTDVKLESTCLATPSPFAPYTTTLTYTSALTVGPSYGIAIKGITFSFSSGNLIFNGVSQSYFDFADNNYTVSCTLDSPTNQPHIVAITKLAAGAGITITIATDLIYRKNKIEFRWLLWFVDAGLVLLSNPDAGLPRDDIRKAT